MSVAAANEWHHVERRVMSKRQRRSGRVKRRQPRCRRGDHDVAGSNLLAGILFIIFFYTLYNEKNTFATETIFKGFKKKKSFKNDCFIGKT
jgi:hypothetical protein